MTSTSPAFAYTIVYVDDVDASLAFVERAFGLARRFLVETGDYGEGRSKGTPGAKHGRLLSSRRKAIGAEAHRGDSPPVR